MSATQLASLTPEQIEVACIVRATVPKQPKQPKTPKERKIVSDKKRRLHTYIAQWRKDKYANDPQFRLQVKLRDMVRRAVKTQHTEQAIGCTFKEFKLYMESKFMDGMTWDNFSMNGWHVDHIRPLSWFDLTDHNQVLTANHFSNLQPKWAFDNRSKGNRYEG